MNIRLTFIDINRSNAVLLSFNSPHKKAGYMPAFLKPQRGAPQTNFFSITRASGSICCHVGSTLGDARMGAASRFLGQMKIREYRVLCYVTASQGSRPRPCPRPISNLTPPAAAGGENARLEHDERVQRGVEMRGRHGNIRGDGL